MSTDSIDDLSSSRGGAKGARWRPFPTPGVKDIRGFFDTIVPDAEGEGEDEAAQQAYKSVEELRLEEDGKKEKHWKRWGPYLSERQWVSSDLWILFSPGRAAEQRHRQPCGKIIRPMGTPGPTSLMSTLAAELTGQISFVIMGIQWLTVSQMGRRRHRRHIG
jgi:hypothetical protein